MLVVEIETSSGVVGTGHLHPLAGGMRTLETCIHEMLKPLLIGQDASEVEALWQRMWHATFIQGRMGITVMAMSALDIALWDAVGRAQGKPLWQLWGGATGCVVSVRLRLFPGPGARRNDREGAAVRGARFPRHQNAGRPCLHP